jgi:hypothetical protein
MGLGRGYGNMLRFQGLDGERSAPLPELLPDLDGCLHLPGLRGWAVDQSAIQVAVIKIPTAS